MENDNDYSKIELRAQTIARIEADRTASLEAARRALLTAEGLTEEGVEIGLLEMGPHEFGAPKTAYGRTLAVREFYRLRQIQARRTAEQEEEGLKNYAGVKEAERKGQELIRQAARETQEEKREHERQRRGPASWTSGSELRQPSEK